MSAGVPAYIGIGSNLGESRAHVLTAFEALSRLPRTKLVARSRLYRTRPFGPVRQGDFINAVAKLETQLTARELLSGIRGIEAAAGRIRDERWGPRTLDLDLLLYGNERIDSPELTVPHPGIAERGFVLAPLLDVAPDLAVPGAGRRPCGNIAAGIACRRHCGDSGRMTQVPHRYIAIEGPIGVGKTSLARRLAATLNAQLVLEQAEENPFLERFYRNPRAGALPAQLFFLFQRAQQQASLSQADMFGSVRVADYLLAKDDLFARMTLDDEEYGLYRQVHDRLAINAPKPDLVVYLQAPVDVLLDRISRRGIAHENLIDRGYLTRLNEAYARFFHAYEEGPLLIVNAATIDPVSNEADYEELLGLIGRTIRGRLYYNPLRNKGL